MLIWEQGVENCALHDSLLNDVVPEARLDERTNKLHEWDFLPNCRRELNLNIERWNPPLVTVRMSQILWIRLRNSINLNISMFRWVEFLAWVNEKIIVKYSLNVPGMSHQEETQRTTQDTLQRLCRSAGLGTALDPAGRAGGPGECPGRGKSGTAAPATQPWIKPKKMDGCWEIYCVCVCVCVCVCLCACDCTLKHGCMCVYTCVVMSVLSLSSLCPLSVSSLSPLCLLSVLSPSCLCLLSVLSLSPLW